MSVADLVSRVQQLHAQFNPAVAAAAAAAPANAAATRATGSAFATELTAARTTGTAGATGAGRSGAGGQAVVDAAKKYLGTPYVFGSNNPANGLDCSGLVQRAYKDLGVSLPRVSRDQAKVGTAVPNLDAARPGDILAFNRPVDHVAIYVGNGKMIAAPKPGDQVKIQSVYETPTAIRRVLPDASVAATGPVVRPAGLASAAGLSGVPYGDLFTAAGNKHGVSPKLLAAVAKVESSYDPRAVSPAGARGLMQLMPGTAAELGVNPLNPAQAVDGAARLLAKHLKDFDSLPLALAAYNAGPGAVRRHGGIPPFAETQAYVPKVRKAMAALG
ncbi:MAG TPA: transglycosylase SLT domain-containing protein [Pilimelia sp.]|nr:transglycosylase SLT domain-containing protein [Pilimelia sp.]